MSITGVEAEIRARINTVWPEVLESHGGGGIRNDVDVERTDLSKIAPPYCVLSWPEWTSTDEAAEDDEAEAEDTFEGNPGIYYVGQLSRAATLAKLRAMLAHFRDPANQDLNGEGEVRWGSPGRRISISAQLDVNRILTAGNLPYLAGRVTIYCVAWEV